MASQQPPPDDLGHSSDLSGRPYNAEKAPPPPAPSLDQRSSLLNNINPGLYHKMGVETVCPSCGLIEPYRHGQYTGALVWHDYSYLRVVCYDQWCRDNIPPEIGPATLIRLDQGAEPPQPYQPKHAAGPQESFIEALLNHHPVTEMKRQTPAEIEAAIMKSREFRALDRQQNNYNLDEAALARIALQENKYVPLADRPKKTRLC
jgi:hypothetical protein